MSHAIEPFVVVQNIGRYKKLLKVETRPDKRAAILQLLEQELAKAPEPIRRSETRQLR
jgi:hypothetical protein